MRDVVRQQEVTVVYQSTHQHDLHQVHQVLYIILRRIVILEVVLVLELVRP